MLYLEICHLRVPLLRSLAGATAPTLYAQVVGADTVLSDYCAVGDQCFLIQKNLLPNTAYDIYCMAKTLRGVLSPVSLKVAVQTKPVGVCRGFGLGDTGCGRDALPRARRGMAIAILQLRFRYTSASYGMAGRFAQSSEKPSAPPQASCEP